MELNFTNTALTVRRTALDATESKVKPLDGVYDEFQKLVFLFDCSGSMNQQIARSYEDQYQWTPEKMAEIRAKCEQAFTAKARADAIEDKGLRAMEMFALGSEVFTLAGWCDYNGKALPDLELQQNVIRHNKLGDFNIPVNWLTHSDVPPTRIEVVQKLAHSELAKRIAKYPKGGLAVLRFGSDANVLYEEGHDETVLWNAVDTLLANDGGTNTLNALAAGIEVCRRKPSPVGVHHFVLVTDGQDTSGGNFFDWIATLKASGVILDYIHIGDGFPNGGIQAVCKATGGEYAHVNSEKALREKFIQAVERRCLPPAA